MTHFKRCVNILLSGDDERLKEFIIEMYDAADNIDAEVTSRVIHVCEYLIYCTLQHRDELTEEELVYFIGRQLIRNLRIVAENPYYTYEEEMLREALIRYTERLGELRRKPEREITEYLESDKSAFEFHYVG